MVDKIINLQKYQEITGVKNVTLDEEFFIDHFPLNPIMPGSLIIEYFLQLATWLILFSSSFKYIIEVHNIQQAKFKKTVRPGDQIVASLKIAQKKDDSYKFEGKAYVGNTLVATVLFETTVIPINSCQVDKVKELFSILTDRKY